MALNPARAADVALGLDFGTESMRALAVSIATGEELAESVKPYPHGVLTEALPGDDRRLPPETALQHPSDYLHTMKEAIREVLTRVDASRVAGIGVDFTACTMLPLARDGSPLCLDARFSKNPHAYVKLWKNHTAEAQADRVNALARARNEPFLAYYGGGVSSEWMLPKTLETLEKAPEVFDAADRFVEAGDWVVHALTGNHTRNATAAGYKGLWSAEHGFPSNDFLSALHPRLPEAARKWTSEVEAPGARAGGITEKAARETGLRAGTPVSVATIDAHSGVAGMGVYREGALSLILGTSSCHMALSRGLKFARGVAGIVKDGILPGFYGYESGQAAVGDAFGWFAKRFTEKGFDALSREAAALLPGESGLLALDGWNGNRTPHMDARLSSVLVGQTLETTPAETYRALIEATAFGTRRIVEIHRDAGVPIEKLVVCGGLVRDALILRIYADVTQLPVEVAASNQAVALGAAIFGARAATGEDLESLITRMTRPPVRTIAPEASARAAYDRLYALYRKLDSVFWNESKTWMHELRALRNHVHSPGGPA